MKLFLSLIMLLALVALSGCAGKLTIASPSLDFHKDGDRTRIDTRGQAEACKQERYAALPDDPSLPGYADRIIAIQRECDQAAEAALRNATSSMMGGAMGSMAGSFGSGMGTMFPPGMFSGLPGLQAIMLPDGMITPSIALEHYPGGVVPINIQGAPGASGAQGGASQQDVNDLGSAVAHMQKELCDVKKQQGKPCK